MCLQVSIRGLLIIAIIILIIYCTSSIPYAIRREISSLFSRSYDQLTHYKYQSSAVQPVLHFLNHTVSASNVQSSVATIDVSKYPGCSAPNGQGTWSTYGNQGYTEAMCRATPNCEPYINPNTSPPEHLCKCTFTKVQPCWTNIRMFVLATNAPTTAPTTSNPTTTAPTSNPTNPPTARVCSTRNGQGIWDIFGSKLQSACRASTDCHPYHSSTSTQYLCKCTISYNDQNGRKRYCSKMFDMITEAPTASPTMPRPTSQPTRPRGEGCSVPSRQYSNTKTIILDKISACAGIIASGGVYGIDAEALCARGYHVCYGEYEVKHLNLTYEMCRDEVVTTDNEFFATQETSPITGQCDCYSKGQWRGLDPNSPERSGRNDIWGCAKQTADCPACGVLSASIGGVIETGTNRYNHWHVHQDGDDKHEAIHARLSEASSGGVLCCIDS